VVFGKKLPFCGPNGQTFVRISTLDFFGPRRVAPVGRFFSGIFRVVPFRRPNRTTSLD